MATKPGSPIDPKIQNPLGLLEAAVPEAVKDSAQQVWLAGMGALAKAQAEGGKVFEALVKEGLDLQKKTQAVAEVTLGEVSGRMTELAGTVTSRAGQNWDKLETIFEARTQKAMTNLGVPTAKDLQLLNERLDALEAAVAKLGKVKAPASPEASAKGAPVAKKSRAKAPAKKAASR